MPGNTIKGRLVSSSWTVHVSSLYFRHSGYPDFDWLANTLGNALIWHSYQYLRRGVFLNKLGQKEAATQPTYLYL